MEHKIIQTENYLLVVSDEEIKKGDWYNSIKYSICKSMVDTPNIDYKKEGCKKVIAHKPLNGAPYLDGVDELPEIEDEVEKLALESIKGYDNPVYISGAFIHYKQGYNKAKETFKYTLEDVAKLIHSWDMHINQHEEDKGCLRLIYEHIQSLNQPKLPIAFEFECKDEFYTNGKLVRTEWVGTYKF